MSFTQQKWDWADSKVHPAVRYPSVWVGITGTADTVIGMVDSFNPRKSTPHDAIHSLSEHNQGFATRPVEYTIDITTKPFGDGFKILEACQNGDRYFDIVLQPIDQYTAATTDDETGSLGNNPSAWGPGYEVFIGCKVNDNAQRYAIGTVPTVTFTCQGLRFSLSSGLTNESFGDGYIHRTLSDSDIGLSS